MYDVEGWGNNAQRAVFGRGVHPLLTRQSTLVDCYMVNPGPIFQFFDQHFCALFSARKWLFRKPKVPANALSSGAGPRGNRFSFFFLDGDMLADNLKLLFALSWVGCLAEHSSETGFGQLLEFPRCISQRF